MDLDELYRIAQASGCERERNKLMRALLAEVTTDLRRQVGMTRAEDLAQETMLIVARKLPEFELRHPGALRAWALKIARRLLWRQRTRQRPDARAEPLSGRQLAIRRTGPLTALTRCEQSRAVARAIEQLPSKYMRVVEQRLEGQGFHAIATAEGLTASAVRVRWCRSVGKIRERLPESLMSP